MTTRIRRNIWSSQRLIFRPAETTDDIFLQSLNEDTSDGFQNAAPFLPTPQGVASAKGYREFLEKCTLGAVIWLPAPVDKSEPDTAAGAAETRSATTNSAPATTDIAPSTSTTPTVPKPKGTPIGTISLMPTEPNMSHHRKTSIGINLHPSYQGQGYGSEAICWALEWAFRHANMHRVAIGAFAWNEGAWKLYERLGFVHEGRAREAMWYDGGWHDMVELGMLKREWVERYGGENKK